MELLAPAGDLSRLKTAVHFGADAVYFSGKNFGLRAFAGNFSDEQIFEAMDFLHAHGKKGYVTVNIVAFDTDFEGLDEYISLLCKAKVDAVIVSDLGLIAYLRKNFPSLAVHVSTQANVTNSQTALFYASLGCTRVVLARELSLDQIAQIYQKTRGKIELEAFVHGAMCISYSGRCLLSNFLAGRPSNRGACVQACRWEYEIREVSRQGSLPIQEDKRGTYILSSKDLCMIEHMSELEKAGVVSAKIEGRMKSNYYVGSVVSAYRRALDSGKADEQTLCELEKVSHRQYTTGFYFGATDKETFDSSSPVQTAVFVAEVVDKTPEGVILEMRNRFAAGEALEVLSPDKDLYNKTVRPEPLFDENGQIVQDVKRVQQRVLWKDTRLQVGDILRR